MNVKCDAMASSKMRTNTGFEKDKLIRSKPFTAQLSSTYIAFFKQQSLREP